MSLKDWLGKNHFATRPENSDPFFRPRRYSGSKEEVAAAAREVIASLGNWRLEEYRENQGLLKVTRSALFPPSAQEINLYVVRDADGITHLEITSLSRGARRDWGRNRKNIRDFLVRMDSRLTPL